MKISLSKALSTPEYRETVEAVYDRETLAFQGMEYPIRKKESFCVLLENAGKRTVRFAFDTQVVLGIPCSRCLEEVLYPIKIQVSETIDFDSMEGNFHEEFPFIEDNDLDVDILLCDEIIPSLPVKVLCREDCKGLCPVCGKNRNQEECGCDRTVADPRMAAIQDVFKKFKEV